ACKTAQCKLVTVYNRSQSGSIRLTSRSGPAELARRPPHAIAGLGIARTFQTLRLYRNLTAIENVLIGMHSRRRDDTLRQMLPLRPLMRLDDRRLEEARETLLTVGLNPDKHGDRQA